MVISEAWDNGRPHYKLEHFKDVKAIGDIFNNDCICWVSGHFSLNSFLCALFWAM